jgi:hypothetical protein
LAVRPAGRGLHRPCPDRSTQITDGRFLPGLTHPVEDYAVDDDQYPLATIVDRIRGYLDQAGLLDIEEFPAIKGDVTELAREIIADVQSSLGM